MPIYVKKPTIPAPTVTLASTTTSAAPTTYPVEVIERTDPHYPDLFTTLVPHDQPRTLYARGQTCLLGTHCLAIIGGRETTELGQRTAFKIAAHFAEAGYTIVSGLCRGADHAAHQGALSVGGHTIAIFGNSHEETDYKEQQHIPLAREILAHKGLLLTEYASGRATGQRLLYRNRLIVALSLAVIPVQLALRVNAAGYNLGGTAQAIRSARTIHREVWYPRPFPQEDTHDMSMGVWYEAEQDRSRPFTKKDYPTLEEHLEELKSESRTWRRYEA